MWKLPTVAAIVCSGAMLLLSACDKDNNSTAPRGGSQTTADVADSTSSAAKDTGDKVRDAARDAGNKIQSGAKDVANKIGEGLDKAGKEIQKQTK